MLDQSYNVGNVNLYVYCEITEYVDIIKKRMSMFDDIFENNITQIYIKIYQDKTCYKINECEVEIIGKILHTDLYPLFNNVLANIINDEFNMLLHSVVLCYNDVGILVVGDFDKGKTTLCLEANNNGFRILSTDQTILNLQNGSIKIKKGSKYMKIKNGEDIITNESYDGIEIKYILNLIGLSDGGFFKYELVDNNYQKIKTLFKFFTWHSDIPLFTDDSLLSIDKIKIKTWLSHINIPLYNVRGDVKEIINNIKERLK